jgi:hypothetical protein
MPKHYDFIIFLGILASAFIGTMLVPGIGTIIGVVVGLLVGWHFSKHGKKEEKVE